MSYIKFSDSTSKIKDAIIVPLSKHIIEVKFSVLNTSGLGLYLDNDLYVGNYAEFTTLYRKIDDTTYQYSNDGSVYIAPIIKVPTQEELIEQERQNKISEIKSKIAEIDRQFKDLDYVGIKIATCRATVDEYKDDIALMTTLADEKDKLLEEMKTL